MNRTSKSKIMLEFCVLWFLLQLTSSFFVDELLSLPSAFGLLWLICLDALGIVLVVLGLVLFVRAPFREKAYFLSPILAALFLQFVSPEKVFALKFWMVEDGYERRVAEILAVERPENLCGPDADCIIDPGPPLRIAFVRPGGILDNFSAVVYDPTGLVMEATKLEVNGSSWDAPELAHVKKLFGGDLCYVRPLGGHWYSCAFT